MCGWDQRPAGLLRPQRVMDRTLHKGEQVRSLALRLDPMRTQGDIRIDAIRVLPAGSV
jgi:hypothetical protein